MARQWTPAFAGVTSLHSAERPHCTSFPRKRESTAEAMDPHFRLRMFHVSYWTRRYRYSDNPRRGLIK
jgi:hypothetical protein